MKQLLAVLLLLCLITVTAPAQEVTTLISFSVSEGAAPPASVIQPADGNLYVTTEVGKANDSDCVFKITQVAHTRFRITSPEGRWRCRPYHRTAIGIDTEQSNSDARRLCRS